MRQIDYRDIKSEGYYLVYGDDRLSIGKCLFSEPVLTNSTDYFFDVYLYMDRLHTSSLTPYTTIWDLNSASVYELNHDECINHVLMLTI